MGTLSCQVKNIICFILILPEGELMLAAFDFVPVGFFGIKLHWLDERRMQACCTKLTQVTLEDL